MLNPAPARPPIRSRPERPEPAAWREAPRARRPSIAFVKVSDKRKTLISVLSYACLPPPYGDGTKGWNMPALKEISFEYARQIATVKGLRPSKVKGTNTLRFSKAGSEKLQVISWDEFEKTASSRNRAVFESGGWMKLMRKQ